jgi:hypothetical protein
MRGYELHEAVEAACHKVCSALGLRQVTVAWSPYVPTAAISQSGRILLKDVAADAVVPKTMLERYVGFVVHELLHRKYTDFSARDGRSYVDSLHNAVEDIWIERQGIKAGLTGNITGLLTSLVNGLVTEALAAKVDWADPAQYPFALAVHGRRYARRVPLAKGLGPIFDEASTRIDNCLNSHDTLVVARWVFDQLQALPQDQPQDQPGKGDDEGDDGQPGEAGDEGDDGDSTEAGDDGEDSGEADGESEGEGTGEGDDGAGDDSEGTGEGEADDGTGEGDDGAGDAGEADGEADGEGDGEGEAGEGEAGPATAPAADGPAREVEPTCPDAGEAGGGGTYSRDNAAPAWDRPLVPGYRVFDTRSTAGGRLKYEVKTLFDNSARTDWAINRKAGALNVRALPSLATGSDRVFKRRDEVEGIDSAVVILLDVSYSMYENKVNAKTAKFECYMEHAVPTVTALHQAVKAAGGEVMVAAFGRTVCKVSDWGAPTVKVAKALECVSENGATNDAAAIRFCGDLLLKRSEARRILFVLTDGDGDQKLARANVDALERLGVTVIGIGIGLDVSGVYPNNIRVNDASALASASFKQIKLAL